MDNTTTPNISEFVGKPYLASDVDVSRGGKIIRLPGDRFVSELETTLTPEEESQLTTLGVLKIGELKDAQATVSRIGAERTAKQARADGKQIQERNADYNRRRHEIQVMHDESLRTALTALDTEYEDQGRGAFTSPTTPKGAEPPHTPTSDELPPQADPQTGAIATPASTGTGEKDVTPPVTPATPTAAATKAAADARAKAKDDADKAAKK